MQSQERKDTVVKVKKAYNTLSNAYLQAKLEYGTPDTWDIGLRDQEPQDKDKQNSFAPPNAKIIRDKLFYKANVTKLCDTIADKKNCNLADNYVFAEGSKETDVNLRTVGAALNDGTSYMFIAGYSPNCTEKRGPGIYLENLCGILYTDTNGKKGPNMHGKDLFMFYLTKYGVIPAGTAKERNWPFTDIQGAGRTAWVLYNENLDYLDCPNELGWDKKKSCKE